MSSQERRGPVGNLPWEYESDDSELGAEDRTALPDFYDPTSDDADQSWVDRHRQGSRQSDAQLSCPGCFTTLCTDCQQHTQAQHRFRAIFVMNCRWAATVRCCLTAAHCACLA